MNGETILTLCYSAAAELYAAALWMCYRRNRPETSDKLLYAAYAVLIFGVREALEVIA